MCWGLFLSIGVGGRYILFYCIFHIYNQQFYFSNWKNNLCPRKRWKDYILFCVCEGICFIRVCVFHRVLDRIDAYNIFLNKKKNLLMLHMGKQKFREAECFVQVRQLVCSKRFKSGCSVCKLGTFCGITLMPRKWVL